VREGEVAGNREDEEMKGRREEDAGAKAKMEGGKERGEKKAVTNAIPSTSG
jgi:hypothetical protein